MSLINIKSLQPKSANLIIKHPITGDTEFELDSGEKVQLVLKVVGRNSQQWLDFMKAMTDKGGLSQGELFSRISDNAKSFVANQIIGWHNNGALKEPYSKEAAEKLINDPENNWLMEQVQEFLINESNFF